MKDKEESKIRRLEKMLKRALAKEANYWKVPFFSVSKDTDISPTDYAKTVLEVQKLWLHLCFCIETLGLAIGILNRVLASAKVHVKYLECTAIACLYLAAKANEEDEEIPSVKELAELSGYMYSSAEILRMERSLLDILHWDLNTSTPVEFLNTFHALMMIKWPHLLDKLPQMNPSLHVAVLTKQLQHCMACHQLLQFRGSTLALAIITLELERMTLDWVPVVAELLENKNMDLADLDDCKDIVEQCLETQDNSVYIYNSADDDNQTPIWDGDSHSLPSATSSAPKKN